MANPDGFNTTTNHANIIPEYWSGNVIDTFQKKLVMANIIDYGTIQEGIDTVFMPTFTDLETEAIVETTAAVGQYLTPGQKALYLNQYFGCPITLTHKLLLQCQKDIKLQALYASKMGKAHALNVDTLLHQLYTTITQHVHCTAGITKNAILEARRILQVNEAPFNELQLIINPYEEENILKIDDFVRADYVGDQSAIRGGVIGTLYGMKVRITNNVQSSSSHYMNMLLWGPEFAMCRVQLQPAVNFSAYDVLRHCYDADAEMLFGYTEIRPEQGVLITTTA